MIICICHNVSDKKVKQVIQEKSIVSIKELKKEINICNQCKMCASDIKGLIQQNKVQADIDKETDSIFEHKKPILLPITSNSSHCCILEN